MAAIGKLQASLASATQETTLALANLNFDFSLFKVEAPPEYRPLGAALSIHRRSEAENGMPHVIARRLGTLFETLLPPMKHLVQAYGVRASEISQSPGVNPSGNKNHGPFQKFVGLDGTSVWAAATSGPAAVAVHLLACMLARVWPSAEAVSIWEELVSERKKALMPSPDADFINTNDVAAAQVAITKEQLADWDASARAWLRAVDTAPVTKKQQKQFMSVLNSINMPVGSQPKVYDGVCSAWLVALSTVDKLVQGASYSVQDGAVLVALSAWHLYPDIVVLGPTNQQIHQNDDLMPPGAILTIGLQSSSHDVARGVHWSLSLAHLRYYGSPVLAQRTVNPDSSRIAFPHFLQAVLGAAIGSWGVEMAQITDCIRLMELMQCCFTSAQAKNPALRDQLPWLETLAKTASYFLAAQGEEKEMCTRLVRLGYRRRTFITRSNPNNVFYLRCLDLSCLIGDHKDGIEFFRFVFSQWDHGIAPLVLRVSSSSGGASSYYYTTVIPRVHSRSDGSGSKHVRWLPETDATQQNASPSEDDVQRFKYSDIITMAVGTSFEWKNPPQSLVPFARVAGAGGSPDPRPAKKDGSRWSFKKQKEAPTPKIANAPVQFDFVAGRMDGVALFCLKDYQAQAQAFGDSAVDIRMVSSHFEQSFIDPQLFSDHIIQLAKTSEHQDLFLSLSALAAAVPLYNGLPGATVSPGVISAEPICERLWAKDLLGIELTENNALSGVNADGYHNAAGTANMGKPFTMNMSRQTAFSCIAYFENASMDINPPYLENVMAISSGDTLYVAGPLVRDPASNSKPFEVHRVVGNIGRAGLAFLIPPQAPIVRPPSHDKWNIINHETFDGKLEDNFSATTLHLSFTGYEFPMMGASHGGRFVDAFFIEALVSVHDSGEWVADIDVLNTLQSSRLFALVQQPTCEKSSPAGSIPDIDVIAIDNWEELLDPPRNVAVVRAHGNWQARLAAASISVMLGHTTILFQGHGCWTCAVKLMRQLRTSGSNAPELDFVFVL